MKKVENGTTTYLRSSVLGGQVVAEINGSGTRTRGYVYLGGEVLAVQQNNQVSWMHQDPVAKSKRVTDGSGGVVSTLELDPWGGETTKSSNSAFQPRHFTTYERDGNASDEAMHRRYNRWHSRFDQPDPYGGSYDMANPQSFNRFAYVQNDPVNFVDPSGLIADDDDFLNDESDPLVLIVNRRESGGDRGSIGGVSFGPMEIEAPPVDGPTGGDFDIEGIRRGLQQALDREGCRELVEWLLGAVQRKNNPLAMNGDIMALFESVLTGRGFTRTPPPGASAKGQGAPIGRITRGNAGIYSKGGATTPAIQLIFDTETAFHELMHLAGSRRYFTDEQFARAIHSNPAYKSRAAYPPNNVEFRRKSKVPSDIEWGIYWHDVLKQVCFGG